VQHHAAPFVFDKSHPDDDQLEEEVFMKRKLKVEHRGDFARRKTYPLIRLRGKWLRQAGFLPDSYVTLSIEQGKIVIVPQNPAEKGSISAL